MSDHHHEQHDDYTTAESLDPQEHADVLAFDSLFGADQGNAAALDSSIEQTVDRIEELLRADGIPIATASPADAASIAPAADAASTSPAPAADAASTSPAPAADAASTSPAPAADAASIAPATDADASPASPAGGAPPPTSSDPTSGASGSSASDGSADPATADAGDSGSTPAGGPETAQQMGTEIADDQGAAAKAGEISSDELLKDANNAVMQDHDTTMSILDNFTA